MNFSRQLKYFMSKFWAFLLVSILLTACGDDDTFDELTLNIKLKYNNNPLVMFEEVEYPDGTPIEFSRFSFYASEFESKSSSFTALDNNSYYFDLTTSHASLESAEKGFTFDKAALLVDNQVSLAFNIGVSPEVNAMSPVDFSSGNDLSRTGEYWSDWNSYVFAKIEGKMDFDNDGVKDAFTLHLGSDDALRRISLDKSSDEQSLIINVDEIFKNNQVIFDLKSSPRIHSLTQIDQINQLMDNIVDAIEFE